MILDIMRASGHARGPCGPWLRAARDPIGGAKNEPLKDTSRVNLHRLTKFGEGRPKDLGGVGEQANKETNTQTFLKL